MVRVPGRPGGAGAVAVPGLREAAPTSVQAPAEQETSTQAYAEILQEVRVAQTALQFLLGFLMAVSVTPRFAGFDLSDRVIYVASLVLALGSFGLLTAPAPFHRLISDPRRKHRLVKVSGQLALWGLVLLMLALSCAVLLVLSVVMHTMLAALLSAGILCWLFGFWFCMPLRDRLRDRRHHS
ncbi:integral membrane protein [Streptomyces clavuligerus]|nr:integral membrane protein [Streptomyces clavuligerus]